jgi:outer membrane protein W
MKNVSLITLFFLAAATAVYAQDSTRTRTNTETYNTTTTSKTYTTSTDREFMPFKMGVGVGWAVPVQTNGGGGGVLFYLEPAYRASDFVTLGFKVEAAVLARRVQAFNNNNDVKGDATGNLSYTLNAQFYFSKENVRPFIGAGAGAYSLAATTFNTAANGNSNGNDFNGNIAGETLFGFYPRVGLDAGHFNLTIDYNFIPKSTVSGYGNITNNYLAIRAGISIGGGKYRR